MVSALLQRLPKNDLPHTYNRKPISAIIQLTPAKLRVDKLR